MSPIFWLRCGRSFGAFLALVAASSAFAAMGLREAAASLEQQLKVGVATSAKQSFRLPLVGSTLVLSGDATLEVIDAQHCRRTVELVYDQPFEHRGLRITNINRRSVQDGPCRNFADAMAAQADISAHSIAVQIGVETAGADSTPGARVPVAQGAATGPAAKVQQSVSAEPIMLTVHEKAIIRDAPNRGGEKLSRADVGMRLQGWRIAGNADWFALDGGLRFISASVVDASDASASTAPVQGSVRRLRLTVIKPAVLRNTPSSKGQKMAKLAVGVERLARKVPGNPGWYELMDSDSRYPLYIHESVVTEKRVGQRP